MKSAIHPKYYSDAQVFCACGNIFTVGSTKQTIKVELCSKCHPFYTGEQKFVDTLGRVERFQKKQQVAQTQIKVLQKKKQKKLGQLKEEKSPKSLREMLLGVQ